MMTESEISEKIKNLDTARRVTEHDRRLFMNDVIVNYLASQLAKAMKEYGVPKITAAFRVALIFYSGWKNDK